MKVSNRNHCIDTIKGFACLFVVLIHYNWGGNISLILKTIGRFAVPYFFFVSGYYLPDADNRITAETVARKLRHTFSLVVTSAVFYAVFCALWNLAMDSSWDILAFMKSSITYERTVIFFLSGIPYVYSHLWYLLSSLYCYLVIFLLRDRPGKTGYFWMFVILLALFSLFVEFGQLIGLSNNFPISEKGSLAISSLFVLRALPFFALGIFLRKQRLEAYHPISFPALLGIVAAGCVLALLEQMRFDVILMYVGTHITVLGLSLLSVWYPQKQLRPVAYIGDKLSGNVYLYHIAVGKCLDLLYAKLHLWGNAPLKAMKPVFVLVGSLAFAQLLSYCKNRRVSRKDESRIEK